MAHKRSSGESRRGSSSSSQQHSQPSESKQMGQSGSGRRQQGTLHPPRQSGSGTTGMKRQQSAQDMQRTDESEMNRMGSSRRENEVLTDDDIERAGLTRESGLDDDANNESR